jgi:hypothetical protein
MPEKKSPALTSSWEVVTRSGLKNCVKCSSYGWTIRAGVNVCVCLLFGMTALCPGRTIRSESEDEAQFHEAAVKSAIEHIVVLTLLEVYIPVTALDISGSA